MAKIKIPIELYPNFIRDPENFIRNIACVSVDSITPFIRNKLKIKELEDSAGYNPFDDERLAFDQEFKCRDSFNRYIHIDLGLRKDAVGISMCHAPYFTQVTRNVYDRQSVQVDKVRLPMVKFDFVGRIKVSQGDEIIFSEIRDLIYEISDRGFPISLITYDGFQSVDSVQILRSNGYRVGYLSIDRTASKILTVHMDKNRSGRHNKKEDYGIKKESTDGRTLAAVESLKDALYEDRLMVPYHPYIFKEMRSAQIDYQKNKVDHPPKGTIDLFQSMAGSCFNLANNEMESMASDRDWGDDIADSFYPGEHHNDPFENQDRDYLYGN